MTTPSAVMPAPGARVGPYEIVRRLGSGGMGVVFEAVDTRLRRRVALKVISASVADDPSFRARFTQEAQAQAALDSPHVVQVFAHGEAGGVLYLASQLVTGGDLGPSIRTQGALPPGTAVAVATQVATGLAAAHAVGLVHRDIKPANVLLRARGDEVAAYVTDFGIARWTGGSRVSATATTQGGPLGTPSYMAPELHTGGTPCPATDVYSLGCVLWAALVGRAPFAGTSDYQLVSAHVSAPVPQLVAGGAFTREVNRILRTAMAKDPGERYPSAAELRDELSDVLRSCPAPSSVEPQGTAPSSRSRGGLAVGCVGLVVLAAGVVGILVLRGGSPDSDEERVAVSNIAAALAADAGFDQLDAECTARRLVQSTGVDALQRQGVLDENLQLVDSGEIDRQVYADIVDIGAGCVFDPSPG